MQTRPFSPDIIFTSIPALLPYLAVTLVVGSDQYSYRLYPGNAAGMGQAVGT